MTSLFILESRLIWGLLFYLIRPHKRYSHGKEAFDQLHFQGNTQAPFPFEHFCDQSRMILG